jgi:hypothetical protein
LVLPARRRSHPLRGLIRSSRRPSHDGFNHSRSPVPAIF